MRGLKVPMERGSNGFVQYEDDDLIENSFAFFLGTYSNQNGTAGECPWDHRFGTPVDGLRHRNIRRGLLEWFASVAYRRVNYYFESYARLVAIERYFERTSLRLRLYWRNIRTDEERPTDVEFQST